MTKARELNLFLDRGFNFKEDNRLRLKTYLRNCLTNINKFEETNLYLYKIIVAKIISILFSVLVKNFFFENGFLITFQNLEIPVMKVFFIIYLISVI